MLIKYFRKSFWCAFIMGGMVLWSSLCIAQARFDVLEIRLEGITLLDKTEVEKTIYPFLGKQKSVNDIGAAAKALENLYKTKGYPTVLVDIPEQDVVGGVVTLEVTEGQLSRLTISDSNYFSISNIKDLIPAAQKGQTPYFRELQQQIAQLNTITGDLAVTPVLRPGKTPGTLEIDLKVDDKLPLHGDVEINNHASSSTTETRLAASVRYDNLWQKFHSFGLQTQVTPEDTDEIQVLAWTYVLPINNKKDRLVVYGVQSDSKIITQLGSLRILGKSSFIGIRYLAPLKASPKLSQSFSVGFDYKDYADSVTIGADSEDEDELETDLSYSTANLAFDLNINKPKLEQKFSVGVTLGLPLGTNSQEEFEKKRRLGAGTTKGGDPNFVLLEGGYSRRQNIARIFEVSNKIDFLVSNDYLVSNEQYGIGGASSVRGYFESQALGDRGVYINAELHVLPHLHPKWKYLKGFNWDFYLFGDFGHVKVLDPQVGQAGDTGISSIGLGFEIFHKSGLHLSIVSAKAQNDSDKVKTGDTKSHLSLEYKF